MSTVNIKSTQQTLKVGEHKGEDMFVMKVDHYSTMKAKDIINYVHESQGIPKGMLRASWEALSQVIYQWTMHGHIVEIPGLGNIRLDVRAHAQKDAADVSADDIYRKKLLLTPNADIKKEMENIQFDITCYDRDGNEVPRS